MHFVKIAILSVSWLALGCNLFSKSNKGSPGENPPVMYAAGPNTGGPGGMGGGGNSGADAGMPPTDAPVADSGDAPGSSVRTDGGPDGAVSGGPDSGKKPADADSHTGAQRWTSFGYRTFSSCTWFSPTDGFCTEAPVLVSLAPPLVNVNVFKTADGGKTWSLVNAIPIEVGTTNASINVYFLSPDDMWFISGLVGAGPSGSIGHSIDGGQSWPSLTSTVNAALGTTPDDAGVSSVPLWQLASAGGKIWLMPQGGTLLFSQNGGSIWKKVVPPADFAAAPNRSLIATQGNLLLRFLKADNSMGLYRWNGSVFVPVEGVFPASSAGDQSRTWWRASPNVEGVLFVDRGPLPAWASPFWAYATTDGGMNFQQLLGGNIATSNNVVGLSDGLAYSSFGSVTSYVAGIFSDASASRYLEIHRTNDAGKTWSTMHSQPYQGDYAYISLSVDQTGAVHAMRTSTDSLGASISYDAHYVLP
jgi:photosystem II stability/assembly factor-like uncharacterized protein